MAKVGSAKSFVSSYAGYASLLEALGYEVKEAKVLERVSDAPTTRARLEEFLAAYRNGVLNGELVEGEVCECVGGLLADLTARIQPEALRLAGALGPATTDANSTSLAPLVAGLPEVQRDWLADIVALTEHRDLVESRKMPVEEFQALLRDFAGDQTLARQKLVAHLRDELRRRGVDMSCEAIEERFRSDPAVRTMPSCVKQIMKGLGDEFRTGLVPVRQLLGDEDADEWLGRAQDKLMFKSQSAMHKAIAEATGLSYDCVHKALSGRKKAKRIHVEVKRCLEGWIAKADRGGDIGVSDEHRGAPVRETCALLPRLRELFRTKQAAYRFISARTGLRAGSIRRYFQDDGRLKFAPLLVYRVAKQLADGQIEVPRSEVPASARRPRRTGAENVAKRAQDALSKWRLDRQNEELAMDFKDLRRQLIAELKQRRARSLIAV